MKRATVPSARMINSLIMMGILIVIIDILHISYQFNPGGQPGWQLIIAPSISTSTIILILLLCLPALLPLISHAISSGYVRKLTGTLRNEGIEEIETNIVRIKLTAEANQSATAYEQKVLSKQEVDYYLPPSIFQEQFKEAYAEVIELANKSRGISSEKAMEFINELSSYYDLIRERFPSSSRRTGIMTDISSIMWSLIPKINNFPISEYINNSSGGRRLAAYKYMEWQPDVRFLDDLLTRALGTLEVPFGQYSALVALQRIITIIDLIPLQKRKILALLKWHSNLRYLETAQDRRRLMSNIIAFLEHGTQNTSSSAG